MRLPIQRKRIGFLIIYLLIGAVFIYNWTGVPQEYQANYAILFSAFVIVGGITFYFYASGKVKMFDPFSIISLLYIMIFVI